MNIAKALKVKSRLVSDLKKAQDLFARENSRRDDNVSKFDRSVLWNDVLKLYEKVVTIKGAIATASVNIQPKLVELAEMKSHINFLNSIQTKEGTETSVVSYGSDVTKEYTWNVYMNNQEVLKMVSETEKIIDETQDEIDDYNAKTKVDYTE